MAAKYSPEQDLILWNGSKAVDVKVDKVITEVTDTEEQVSYKLKNMQGVVKEELLYSDIDDLIEFVSDSIKDNYEASQTNP